MDITITDQITNNDHLVKLRTLKHHLIKNKATQGSISVVSGMISQLECVGMIPMQSGNGNIEDCMVYYTISTSDMRCCNALWKRYGN